ncbi:MAG: alpha/beta hydrolase, partial [Ralstonia sp.]|nr:alpha/beta hydrolase [Ralstonia sp.]
WRSVYKLHHLTEAELTFVLTSGGHNAGIVSPPANSHRRFQLQTRHTGETSAAPDDWLASAPATDGSWWPAWHAWLVAHASGSALVKPPKMGVPGLPPLADAPGTYVLEK